jgi:putative N6-adenine-specific DNA methylase
LKLIAKTFKGLENVLAGELTALGAKDVKILKRAVSFESNKELLYKSNLWSRTALRILQPFTTFKAKNEYELYEAVKAYNWMPYLNVDQTLAVDAVVYSRFFTHSKYVALKVKDAICDQFRDATGKRPSVDLVHPTLLLNVHIAEDEVSISMDSSGEPLNRRGYRTKDHPAPINESLAAGMLLLAGWDGSVPFLDPMCGSGTIVMEATMIAAKMAPNIRRKEFGFMRWNNYDADLWQRIVDEAKAGEIKPKAPIFGSDIAVRAIDISRQSALDFGLKQYINYSVSAFRDTVPPSKKGLIVMNPPYDERLKERDVVRLYSEIGTQLKHVFCGWEAWIISSNFEALKFLALKPGVRHNLYNGALECRYQQFKMYEGSLKTKE